MQFVNICQSERTDALTLFGFQRFLMVKRQLVHGLGQLQLLSLIYRATYWNEWEIVNGKKPFLAHLI